MHFFFLRPLDSSAYQKRNSFPQAKALMLGNIFSHLQNIIFNFKRRSHMDIITSVHHFVNFFSVRNNNMTQKVRGKMAESSDESVLGNREWGIGDRQWEGRIF